MWLYQVSYFMNSKRATLYNCVDLLSGVCSNNTASA